MPFSRTTRRFVSTRDQPNERGPGQAGFGPWTTIRRSWAIWRPSREALHRQPSHDAEDAGHGW